MPKGSLSISGYNSICAASFKQFFLRKIRSSKVKSVERVKTRFWNVYLIFTFVGENKTSFTICDK